MGCETAVSSFLAKGKNRRNSYLINNNIFITFTITTFVMYCILLPNAEEKFFHFYASSILSFYPILYEHIYPHCTIHYIIIFNLSYLYLLTYIYAYCLYSIFVHSYSLKLVHEKRLESELR